MEQEIQLLAKVALFADLSPAELDEVFGRMQILEAKATETIIKESEALDHPLYVLLTGTVDVIKHGLDGRPRVISTLSAPSVFGEIELVARRRPIAGVLAASDVRLATLSRTAFDQMCADGQDYMVKVTKNLAYVLASRLAAADEHLAGLLDLGPSSAQCSLSNMRSVLYSGW